MTRQRQNARLCGLNGRSRDVLLHEEVSETDSDITRGRRRRSSTAHTFNSAGSDEESTDFSTTTSVTTEEPSVPKTRAATRRISKPRYDENDDGEWESDNEAYGFAPSTFNHETGKFDKSQVQINAEWHAWAHKHVFIDGLTPQNRHLPVQKPTLGNLKEPPKPISSWNVAIALHAYKTRVPIYLKPPVLEPLRPVVDEHTVWLYSEEGCKTEEERWKSALSSTPFNGPRKHAPYRELYRLTDPDVNDDGDWAENIRWAKEQYREFGSKTWTEYESHLETITQVRRDTNWISAEAINVGK